MKVNVNHPSFISFLENVTTTILAHIPIDSYFSLNSDKKLNLQYTVFKMMKNSVNLRAKLSDNELRSFVVVLCKKNEESENYEFAEILKDISNNFDSLVESAKPMKRQSKTIKVDKNNNG